MEEEAGQWKGRVGIVNACQATKTTTEEIFGRNCLGSFIDRSFEVKNQFV